MTLNAYDRINLGADSSGRPLVVNRRTAEMLSKAVKRAGLTGKVVIVQGSYRAGNGAEASAGTHDGGGVIDIRTWNLTAAQRDRLVLELRRAGFWAWYRTKAQGFDPHIHAVARGDRDLDPDAAAQVNAGERGLNGLASRGPDDGPRVPVPVFQWAPPNAKRIDAAIRRALAISGNDPAESKAVRALTRLRNRRVAAIAKRRMKF